MKKALGFVFLLVLLFTETGNADSKLAEQAINIEQTRAQIGTNFTNIALNQYISNGGRGMNTSAVEDAIQKYSTEVAKILLGAGLDVGAIEIIMEKSAVWHGDTLAGILKGKNLNSSIQQYCKKITDLFGQKNLTLDIQSRIVALTSIHFEDMNFLLNYSL